MTRAALREMGDAQRAWLRRIATTASVALALFALFRALPRQASCPQPAHPKPGAGYACDPTGPTYHHPLLWLLVAAAALGVLVAVRRYLRDDA
jgi:hypothetical protein